MPDDASLIGSTSKEKESRSVAQEGRSEDGANIVEVGYFPDLPPQLEDYLEKVEKENHFLKNQVLDDQTGQTLVTSSQAQKPKIVLPLTLSEYHSGLKKSIESSWRWLSEWSKRLVKMLGSQVGFKEQ